jgi:hypothetical protein
VPILHNAFATPVTNLHDVPCGRTDTASPQLVQIATVLAGVMISDHQDSQHQDANGPQPTTMTAWSAEAAAIAIAGGAACSTDAVPAVLQGCKYFLQQMCIWQPLRCSRSRRSTDTYSHSW